MSSTWLLGGIIAVLVAAGAFVIGYQISTNSDDRELRRELCDQDPECARRLLGYCQRAERPCYERLQNRARRGELPFLDSPDKSSGDTVTPIIIPVH